MNEKLENMLMYIFAILFIFSSIFILLENIDSPVLLINLFSYFLIFLTIKYVYMYYVRNYKFFKELSIFFDLVFIAILGVFIEWTSYYKLYYVIIIIYVIINYSRLGIFVVTCLSSIFYIVIFYLSMELSSSFLSFSIQVFSNSLPLISSFVIGLIIKEFLRQGKIIDETIKKLNLKTLEQENTYQELLLAYKELEEMTIVKERNRMAREIHDTLGHTLTTALIEIEAGKVLIAKNSTAALTKFELARNQVKKGLNDVRYAVRSLDEKIEISFIESIKSIINETTRHTGVIIRTEIDDISFFLSVPQQKTLYRALQEGLTNGIKHGESTTFIFKLKKESRKLLFFLEDNGLGCKQLVMGFGLKAMQERVQEQNGTLVIDTGYKEGFTLKIEFEIMKENINEEN